MPEVTKRHRRLAIVAEYTETALNLVTIRDWVETGEDGQPPWNRSAQALADIEAAALASKPTLYEAHGHVVAGPPGNAVGTGCLLCDMIQTVGPHDPECATRAGGVDGEREHLEEGARLLTRRLADQMNLDGTLTPEEWKWLNAHVTKAAQ